MSNIAMGIKQAMLSKGVRQKFVAERAGFTSQQFSDMLSGRKVIKADYLPAIAKAIGVGIDELYAAGRDVV